MSQPNVTPNVVVSDPPVRKGAGRLSIARSTSRASSRRAAACAGARLAGGSGECAQR